jgi:hypothetical protein
MQRLQTDRFASCHASAFQSPMTHGSSTLTSRRALEFLKEGAISTRLREGVNRQPSLPVQAIEAADHVPKRQWV